MKTYRISGSYARPLFFELGWHGTARLVRGTTSVDLVVEVEKEEGIFDFVNIHLGLLASLDLSVDQLRLVVTEEREPTGHCGSSPGSIYVFTIDKRGNIVREQSSNSCSLSAPGKDVIPCPDCESSPCRCVSRRSDDKTIDDR